MSLDVEKLDFDKCEDEKIHIPEAIQSYGYLFVLDPETGKIEIISENVKTLLSDTKNIIGTNFFDLLDKDNEDFDFFYGTYERAKTQKTRLPIRVRFEKGLTDKVNSNGFFSVIFDSNGKIVVELEPAAKFRETYSAQHYIKLYAMSVAPKFKTYESLDSMAQEIVNTIKYITDMERVVLYKFNEDRSGQVIAEAKVDNIESYLGLYYPASDIPPQARDLYKKNWVRLMPNVDLEPSKLIPTIDDSKREPLDMTHSLLRSLSPIHRQYVKNQGLKASFSMSLVTHDELWGMISCHSRQPVYIPQNVRLQCENLSQLFSWHLYAKEEELYIEKKRRADSAIDTMLDKTSPDYPIIDVFRGNKEAVLEIMAADGFAFFSEGETFSIGQTPELPVVKKLYNMAEKTKGQPFVSNKVTDFLDEEDKDDLNDIRGVLLIPLTEKRNFFTAWFRKETKQIQKWAGLPEEKSANASKKERLTPRSSFQVHIKEIHEESKQWDQNDIDMASRFNRVFLAHALETHEKMRKNLSNLQEQDRYKNEFLATLAHELRNPLAPIGAGISLLEKKQDPDTQSKVINTMKRQVGHMTKMINDLLDVSRITRGKIKLEKENLAIQKVIKNAVETCTTIIEENKHNLSLNLPEDFLWINGDATRLSQIFSNILNNASKYTDPGGKIEILVTKDKEWVSVKIKDNGLGIPENKLNQIFDMFTQVDAHSTHTKGGLGIGLTLVQRLVLLHGGKIKVRSDGQGEGTEFEVLLPLVQKDIKTADSKTKEIEENMGNQQKILVVDDNPDILTMYRILLETEGYEVETSADGKETIEKFKIFKPDVALLDIGLPDIDGYELCETLSKTPEGKNTIFLSQSGWGSDTHIDKAHKAGFREHFTKPLDTDILLAALGKHLKT